jgi:hypothetical protein
MRDAGTGEGVCMLLSIAYSLLVRISHLKCEMRKVRTFETYVHFDARVVYYRYQYIHMQKVISIFTYLL